MFIGDPPHLRNYLSGVCVMSGCSSTISRKVTMNNYLESIDRSLRRLRSIKKAMELKNFKDMIEKFNKASDSCRVSEYASIWIEVSTNAFTYEEGNDLSNLLEIISEYCELKSTDRPSLAKREYTGKVKFRDVEFVVEVTANLMEGSSACKRIIVGEEEGYETVSVVVKRPKYAFQC
jgi:hypothetical protein